MTALLMLAAGVSLMGCSPQEATKTPTPHTSASQVAAVVKDVPVGTYPDGVVTEKDGRIRVTVDGKTTYAPSGSGIVIEETSSVINGKQGRTTKKLTINGVTISNSSSTGSGGAATRTIEQQAAVGSTRRLHVQTDYGSIRVSPAKNDVVAVKAMISLGDSRLTAAQQKKYIAGFTLEIERKGNMLSPRIVPPRDFPKDADYTVAYEVSVPASVDLDLESGNGAVAVENTHTRGKVSAISGYGSVTVSHAGKDITAKSDNGKVSVTCDNATDRVDAQSEYGAVAVTGTARTITAGSQNGSVTIDGAGTASFVKAESEYGAIRLEDCAGEIIGTSQNGSVEFSGTPTRLTLTSDYGRVRARIDDARGFTQGNMESDNGAVEIELPPNASVAVDAHTDNGSIHLDNAPGTVSGEYSEKRYRQSINGGKFPVRLVTDYGSITIRIK